MKRTILILSTLIALSLPGMADKDNQHETDGYANGRAWVIWENGSKLMYIAGYGDHWMMAHKLHLAQAKKGNNLGLAEDATFMLPNLTYGEIRDALDLFYGTPENANISIVSALSVINMRVNGMDEFNVQGMIENMRKHAAKY